MKSLNDNQTIHKNSKIFNTDLLEWLNKEGFNTHSNDSYCDKITNDPYEGQCFYKNCSEGSNYHIGVYIFSYGIGVDIDYDCGGNSSIEFWSFENLPFEEAYDKMVDYVNGYKC